jgi:hypothetical protein
MAQQQYQNELAAWRARNQEARLADQDRRWQTQFDYRKEQDMLNAEADYARNQGIQEEKLIDNQRLIERDQAAQRDREADNERADAALAATNEHRQAALRQSADQFARAEAGRNSRATARQKGDDEYTPEEESLVADEEADLVKAATADGEYTPVERAQVQAKVKSRKAQFKAPVKKGSKGSSMGELKKADEGGAYASPDEVKAAVLSGKLPREQGLQILKSQFGFTD